MSLTRHDAALARGRARAEALMRDSCIVEHRIGDGPQDEATGAIEPIWAPRFEAPCQIKDQGYADSAPVVGGQAFAVGTTVVKVPWDVAAVEQDDRITITAVGPTTAPRHLGKRYYISTDHDRSNQTATRLVVKEDPWQ